MDQSIFDQYDIFKTMHPVKIQVMKELMQNMNGMQPKDAMPLLMAANAKLKGSGQSFTQEEVGVLLEILTKDMPPQEKAKLQMMQQMLKKWR